MVDEQRIITWVALGGAALAYPPLLILYMLPILVAVCSKKGVL